MSWNFPAEETITLCCFLWCFYGQSIWWRNTRSTSHLADGPGRGIFFTCLLATKEDQESNSLAGETHALADGIDSAMFSSSPLLGTWRRKCHAGRLACDIYYKQLLANGGHRVHWISGGGKTDTDWQTKKRSLFLGAPQSTEGWTMKTWGATVQGENNIFGHEVLIF